MKVFKKNYLSHNLLTFYFWVTIFRIFIFDNDVFFDFLIQEKHWIAHYNRRLCCFGEMLGYVTEVLIHPLYLNQLTG